MYKALLYLVRRFFFRIKIFLGHWYVKSARIYSNFVLNQLERLDRLLAWRITLRNLFQPLYGDFSLIGYVLGFCFRVVRLIFGSIVYLAVFIIALGVYIFWLIIPPFVVLGIIIGSL